MYITYRADLEKVLGGWVISYTYQKRTVVKKPYNRANEEKEEASTSYFMGSDGYVSRKRHTAKPFKKQELAYKKMETEYDNDKAFRF